MMKLSTFLVLLLALNYFAVNGSSIRENGWNYKHGTGSSGSNRENGHVNGWTSRQGTGAAGFNPGSSDSNNGHGYNDGSSAGAGFNSGWTDSMINGRHFPRTYKILIWGNKTKSCLFSVWTVMSAFPDTVQSRGETGWVVWLVTGGVVPGCHPGLLFLVRSHSLAATFSHGLTCSDPVSLHLSFNHFKYKYFYIKKPPVQWSGIDKVK